jgi:hypothetical protein
MRKNGLDGEILKCQKRNVMLKPSIEQLDATDKALQASPQGKLPRYIFSDETFQALQALGEVLRRVHNRLETEKAATVGVKSPNNVSIKK